MRYSLVHSQGCVKGVILTLRAETVEDAVTELMKDKKRLRLILSKSPKLLHTITGGLIWTQSATPDVGVSPVS